MCSSGFLMMGPGCCVNTSTFQDFTTTSPSFCFHCLEDSGKTTKMKRKCQLLCYFIVSLFETLEINGICCSSLVLITSVFSVSTTNRGATDQKPRGSDNTVVLSHKSDNFLDQQGKKIRVKLVLLVCSLSMSHPQHYLIGYTSLVSLEY